MMDKIREFLYSITKKQWMMAGGIFAAVVVIVAGGIIFYNYQKDLENALKEQEKDKPKQEIVIETEEESEVIEVIQQSTKISFSGTSIEKDLKIKIVDEFDKLISGVVFKVFVAPEKAEDKKKEYVDEDMDGIIHITGMEAGKYIVTLEEQEHYAVAENPITVEVKGKIEYQKVDVSSEIKKEDEVNTKVEDTGNKKPQVEKPIQNTLPFLESTVTRPEVKKQDVSMENFTPAFASEEKQEEIFGATKVQVPQSVTLYSQGGEQSKKYTIHPYEVQTRDVTIQDIAWTIDNVEMAGIESYEDKSVTIWALQNGTAVVSATITFLDESGTPQTKVLQISIQITDVTDDKTQLLDKEGNGLYLDSDAKQIATLKDYGTTETFYKKPQYTGWQTLDGYTYYFDENHKAVTGKQIIGFFTYSFDAEGKLIESLETKGIDVSKWQADIDWKAVAGAGIDFAIIRVGYRGSETGVLVEDPYFKANIAGATKAGVKVGVYFFTQAITQAEAVEEASMAMELVKGYHLDYPIYIDTEWAYGRADNLGKRERTDIIKAFCKTVQNSGYKAGIYASKSWFEDKLYDEELKNYTIWVAQYNTACTYEGKYDMWQYTSEGRVPGIKGNVDLNICYKGR